MEAGGRHALGAARESAERESASHRGLRADRRDRGAGRDAGAVPLRARGTWPGAARRLPAGAVQAIDARLSAAGIPGGLVVGLLARGVEVRRARLPLLPARHRPRDRHAAHRGGGARLVRARAGRHGGRGDRRAPRPRPRGRLRGRRARRRGARDGALARRSGNCEYQPRSRRRARDARRTLVRKGESPERRRSRALGGDRSRGARLAQAMTSAGQIIHQRRSLLACDARTSIAAERFYRMLGRVMPQVEVERARRPVPWESIPWQPAIHFALFVHRVEGIEPGLYAMARDPAKVEKLKASMHLHFAWQSPPGCPEGLPLYLLERGNARQLATQVSCRQDVAGDGAFSLGMLAEYEAQLVERGPAFYRRFFWEAGAIGQVLYAVGGA